MSLSIFAFLGCALTACILIVLIKQYKPEIAVAVSIAAGIALLLAALSAFSEAIDGLREIARRVGAMSEYITPIVKVFGVCVITQLAADVCRDAGQQSIASKVELGGKLAALIVSLPMFYNVLELSLNIIG